LARAFLATVAAGVTISAVGFDAAGATAAGAAATRHTISFAPSAQQIGTAPCSDAEGFTGNAGSGTFGGGGCAGYVGSGRDFRYAQAIITVPQANVVPLTDPTVSATAPTLYVGLTSGDAMAAAGLMTCANFLAEFTPTSGPCGGVGVVAPADNSPADAWVAVGWVVANNGAAAEAIPLAGANPGDGVRFQVYYPGSGAVHFTITTLAATPTSHSFQLPAADAMSAVFDHAVALVDYSASDLGADRPGLDPGPAAGAADLRITQFQAGGWTTTSGMRGTFRGPWTLNAATLTNNGLFPPAGTVNVEPAYLWNDGLGGGLGDAFGIWWRH
jgi:hypothetical protein